MADVVPVDQFLEWYPGWTPELSDSPWVAERPGPFTKADEARFWFVDFHWPRGFSPLGYVYVTDCFTWATQSAAHSLPLPTGRGLATRLGGPFPYASEIPVTSRWEVGHRAARLERTLPGFVRDFDATWEERKWELQLALGYFESYDFAGRSLAEIGQYLTDARAFQRRAWEIHFELMYPLLANYLRLYELCSQNDIDPAIVAKFLQGRDSRIMETDRAMWDLVAAARRLGIAELFDTDAEMIRDRLAGAGGRASQWLTRFDDFLDVYGWRTDGIADTNLPPWIEYPASPLGQLRTFLSMAEPHDFDKAAALARHERDESIEAARLKLSGATLTAFNELLAANEMANFAWWNEDHNFYIDLRASIPLRRAALALAAACGADVFDDGQFLFFREALDICVGQASWKHLRPLVTARRQYYDHFNAIRPTLPKIVGTLPDKVDDPALIEIFGLHHRFFQGLHTAADATVLRGLPAAPGAATGRARVMISATRLGELVPGEILVCEATSPNWTPAFGVIAGCVCDGGGSLTHAAIVAREYRVPCVVGCSVATARIRTGDLVEVDGTHGVVTILERGSLHA